ncbi:SIS domain-containing protein [Bacillus salacetis]|uniref:SIS domain-containing protein n=1 Tax=Bacillus salacetis TaxID=2315464 RepID=UPI003B9E769D
MFQQYFQKLNSLLAEVEKNEAKAIETAGREIARCIQQNGIIHVFGCGHSHILGEELFYRAGGLVPVSPILVEDLMLHKGAVRSSKLEKDEHLAEKVMAKVDIRPEDVVIVVSTSGRNPVPIDVARIAKDMGAFVIGITSPRYAETQPSRHHSGKYLFQSVDLVIDNHIEVGDALMEAENLDVSFGTGSTVIGTAIANGIMVEAVEEMIQDGFAPPIFKSGNVDGAEQHNQELIDKYKSRIPLLVR